MIRFLAVAGLAAAIVTCGSTVAQEVTMYTTREPGLIRPLLEAYTVKTGTKVNTVFLQGGLAERVAAEGTRSPADVMLVVDAGTLVNLAERGLTQPVRSEALESAIPAAFRDPSGQWFALSLRARVIFVSKDRVSATETPTYEDLASPRWKGKICLRSGQHPYNVALFAVIGQKHGQDYLVEYLTRLKGNLAHRPSGGDRDVAKDILAGQCDAGLSNIYYYGLMASGSGGPEQKIWADSVRVVLPTFADKVGTHTNVSGAAVAKYAPHRDEAIKLLEFLVTPDAQRMLTDGNFEAPVRPGVSTNSIVAAFGTIKPDDVGPAAIAAGRSAASMAVDRVQFDQ